MKSGSRTCAAAHRTATIRHRLNGTQPQWTSANCGETVHWPWAIGWADCEDRQRSGRGTICCGRSERDRSLLNGGREEGRNYATGRLGEAWWHGWGSESDERDGGLFRGREAVRRRDAARGPCEDGWGGGREAEVSRRVLYGREIDGGERIAWSGSDGTATTSGAAAFNRSRCCGRSCWALCLADRHGTIDIGFACWLDVGITDYESVCLSGRGWGRGG